MGTSNKVVKIQEIIRFVEEHIKEDLSLEDIAKHTGLSKYHQHRMFKASTGMSLMSYVRGRKLTHSVNELLNTDLNIIDIAYEYGFKHEQTYTRSFKKMFQLCPSQLRRTKDTQIIENKIDSNRIRLN